MRGRYCTSCSCRGKSPFNLHANNLATLLLPKIKRSVTVQKRRKEQLSVVDTPPPPRTALAMRRYLGRKAISSGNRTWTVLMCGTKKGGPTHATLEADPGGYCRPSRIQKRQRLLHLQPRILVLVCGSINDSLLSQFTCFSHRAGLEIRSCR